MPAAGLQGVLARRASVALAAAAAGLPIVIALVRGLARGWYPVGDNAYFAIRAGDVFTEHHPLLGTWTSASQSLGVNVNNPGPLLFDLYALPTKLDAVAGTAVGAALVNLASVALIGVFAHRRGGAAASTVLLAAAAGLGWSMGSELLYDPWQPHVLLLPFLALLVLVWSLVCGDAAALPFTVFVASLIVQTHLGYALIVPALCLLAVAVPALEAWRRRGEGSAPGPGWRRPIVAAVVVALACWAQPLIEQVTADGQGNVARLASAGSSSEVRVGAGTAARLLAAVVAIPPAWSRPSFDETFVPLDFRPPDAPLLERYSGVPGPASALVALALLVALLVGAAWWSNRHGDRLAPAAIATGAVALAVGFVTLALLPLSPIGIASHQFRWLWPLSVFLTAGMVLALFGRSPLVVPAAAVVAAVLAVGSVRTHEAVAAGPASDAHAMDVMLELSDQLEALGGGPYLISAEQLQRLEVFEPYSTPVMLELERHGVEFVVDDAGQGRQLGERRLDPAAAEARLFLLLGDDALTAPAGAERVALVNGLDDQERAELARLESALRRRIERHGVSLTPAGRRALEAGALEFLEPEGSVRDDPGVLLVGRRLASMLAGGMLDVSAGEESRLARYVELRRRADQRTVAVFVEPLEPSGP